jgi:methionyl-tRNA formyltransferase
MRMSLKKIVFLGSKPVGYECLAYLISQREALGIEITGLLTRARKEFGNAHDLNELANEFNIPILDDLNDIPQCDIIYSVQYHQVLKQEHINKAHQLCANLHMAPLPEYRGANQFTFAIIDEKTEFGTTIHKIDTRIDHGDILFQKRFPIPANCWVNELYQLTFDASVALFRETLADIAGGNYQPKPQDQFIEKYGTSLHFRKEMDALRLIDLSWDKEKIERHVRATSMPGFEPPYCLIDGKKVYLTSTC